MSTAKSHITLMTIYHILERQHGFACDGIHTNDPDDSTGSIISITPM